MSEAAVLTDEVTGLGLRQLADRLLETRRVEYVDDGVILVMNPPAPRHRALPPPLGFSILTAEWPS